MSKFKFYPSTELDETLLNQAFKTGERLAIPKKLIDELIEWYWYNDAYVAVIEEVNTKDWYVAYFASDESIHLYEITNELLDKINKEVVKNGKR